MSLKLRLNLIVAGLLLVILMAGAILAINNAKQNARAEIASAEKLALYIFDSAILAHYNLNPGSIDKHTFQLQRLNHMRHLRIQLYDNFGNELDSNRAEPNTELLSEMPQWVERILGAETPGWEPNVRQIKYAGHDVGALVLTPDPTYEYAEIWHQIMDLLFLSFIFYVSLNLMIAWAVGQALKPTEKILIALNELECGNLKARLPVFELPELSRIGEKFNRMVETMEQSITRNHWLSQQLICLQEAERKSLARDLHDEFGQCLTAIHTDASVVLRHAEKKYPELLGSALAITKISRHLMELVTGMLHRLRPGILDEMGLTAALEEHIETWKSGHYVVHCTFHIDYDPHGFDEVDEVTVYRMVQECLTNISRHSQARCVDIQIGPKFKDEKSGLLINVKDDGKGFEESNVRGLGLAGMRERFSGLGGEFLLKTLPGQGTLVQAWIPQKGGV